VLLLLIEKKEKGDKRKVEKVKGHNKPKVCAITITVIHNNPDSFLFSQREILIEVARRKSFS